MRLSLQVCYAICGLFDLAYNGQGGAVQVRVIGERQQIPPRYLEQVFQKLRKSGLVQSKRGPGGGYRLSRPPQEISLRDILEAIEGPMEELERFAPSLRGKARAGPGRAPEAPFRPDFLWSELARQLASVFEATSVDALCRQAARAAVRRAGAETYTYQI